MLMWPVHSLESNIREIVRHTHIHIVVVSVHLFFACSICNHCECMSVILVENNLEASKQAKLRGEGRGSN